MLAAWEKLPQKHEPINWTVVWCIVGVAILIGIKMLVWASSAARYDELRGRFALSQAELHLGQSTTAVKER